MATIGSTPSKGQVRPRWKTHHEVAGVSMMPPPMRLVFVHVCADANAKAGEEPATWVEIVPVLGIVAKTARDWTKPASGSHALAATAQGMERLGWQLEGSGVQYECLVVDPEFGTVAEASMALDAMNAVNILCPAPWAPELDETRLARQIERGRAQARRLVGWGGEDAT
jgi:hypothetical protein